MAVEIQEWWEPDYDEPDYDDTDDPDEIAEHLRIMEEWTSH